ncbi:MAG: hypothetical protein HWD92_04840 [Flavobacteriia bacterium]|nr:hypothetical protein [Flavobacteriia bacterium]
MTRLQTIYSVAVFTLLSAAGYAQNSHGYLGKKSILQYDLGFNTNYFLGRSADMSVEENSPVMRFEHNIIYQRVVGRKWTLVGRAGYSRNYLKSVRDFNYPVTDNTGVTREYTFNKSLGNENQAFNTITAEFGFRRYSRITAPIGHYYGFTAGYAMMSMEYAYNNYARYSSGNYYGLYLPPASVSSGVPFLGWEMGATRVIDQQWVIEYGGSMRFTFPTKSDNYYRGSFSLNEPYANYGEREPEVGNTITGVEDALQLGFAGNTTLMFHVSFGWLH